jgi:protein Tex
MTQPQTQPTVEVAYDPISDIAASLGLPPASVAAVVKLLAEGSTVPFIARYRKEATAGLDEVAIRNIEERRTYLLDLHDRKRTVLAEISKQGKLTPQLEAKIRAASTKAEVEDLYLPFKPKRRTRAAIARERGLEPLAELMWTQASGTSPQAEAPRFVDAAKEVPDVAVALAGARDICAERIAELAEVRKALRATIAKSGVIQVEKTRELREQVTKFDMYAEFSEPLSKIPSHRFLAIRRGETENVLRSNVEVDTAPTVALIDRQIGLNRQSAWAPELELAIADSLKRLLRPSAELDVLVELKLKSDNEAIGVFADNLKELLLAAPFGTKRVIGIDPGQRTGCKCAVADENGRLVEHTTIYLVQGEDAVARSRETLKRLLQKHKPAAIAVGNGTHGRETEAFVREVLAAEGMTKDGVFCAAVSESGASIYSASDIAREEFPDLDLTIRGAISIARRMQDPLAELVKVDAKSIGVGQYQHDVYQPLLARKLDEVVESCVNQVGVEVNTASAPLLSRVAGIGPSVAKKIVAHRDQHGSFKNRKQLLDVSGLGPSTFEQAAGFLRIFGAENPLDASAVHPERYALVQRIAADLGVPVQSLVCNAELLGKVDIKRYESGDVGAFTLRDILAELQKPGRDPRASFEPPKFRDDVQKIEDLQLGMELEGVVTNVTAFGAFVDVGVHQDGLVHVSQLADRFVKNPSDVVKVGDKLKVRVMEVDLQRKRIGLSARKDAVAPRPNSPQGQQAPNAGGAQSQQRSQQRPQQRNDSRPGTQHGTAKGPDPRAAKTPLSHNPFADRFKR